MYDIESRLAELFIENLKQENRESVSIPDVEQAISIMGKRKTFLTKRLPGKLPNNKRLARKRLYPENCSGTRKTASWEAWPPGSPRTWEFRSPSHVYVSCWWCSFMESSSLSISSCGCWSRKPSRHDKDYKWEERASMFPTSKIPSGKVSKMPERNTHTNVAAKPGMPCWLAGSSCVLSSRQLFNQVNQLSGKLSFWSHRTGP